MNKKLSIPLVATLLLTIAQPAFADHGTNFHCSGFPIKSDQAKENMSRIAHNNGMRNIVLVYVYQWENEEIKRTCDAAVAGNPADLTCLDGRRDWIAIQSKIPDDLAGKSNQELRPHMLKLQEQGFNASKRREILKYCEDLGVLDLSVKG